MDRTILLVGFVAILHWCGKFVSSQSCSHSTIKSPGYPGSYPENVDCTWTKSTSTGIIRLYISNLDLEQCARCTCDYVEVFDGSSKSSKSLGKFCTGPVRLLSTGSYLTVVFHTDHSKGEKSNNGFRASYYYISRSAVCKQVSNTISTNYASYGNVDCSWTLGSNTGYIVVLEVSSLSFGTCSTTCSCGQLDVYDTSEGTQTKIGSWCSPPQKSIISKGRNMLVRFVATPTSTTQDFRAEYKFVKDIGVCEQTTTLGATEYSQTVKSYDRPSEYIRLVDCTWKITAKDGQLIQFTVGELDMGGCASCGFLQIYDGETEWIGQNLGKWRSGTPKMISSGKYMIVKFKTTKFDTNNGLVATYRAIPKTNVCPTPTANQGIIKSYNYPYSYPGNINCFWKLKAPANYLIRFYTGGMSLSTDDCKDKCNFLAVYDGSSITDSKLGSYEEEDVSLVSSSSQLSLVFKTYKEGSGGFRGNYLFIHKNEVCKDNLNLHAGNLGQTISSRNFPVQYWGNMRCFWRIQADRDHMIRLVVQTIDFENCTDCRCDYIHIFDGPNRNSKSFNKWCHKHADLISSGAYLYIEMHTDAKKSYRGFKAKYFAIHKDNVCPGSGLLTKELGTIKSPNYPEHYYGGIACDWTITVADGKRIHVKSRSMNLERCLSCDSCDHIEISDSSSSDHTEISNSSSPEKRVIGKWCKTPFDVISRGNTVNIRFISNVNDVGESFVIEYETVNVVEVCPLKPTSHSSGTLTSLGYPNGNYPGNLNCQYRMKAPNDNQVVRLEFTHFQLATCGGYVSSCLYCGDTVQAIDVGDDIKLAPFYPWCSINSQPTHIFSSGQNLFLNFHTDASSQDSGFRATYRSVDKNLGCLGTGTLSKSSGNFSGPRSPFNSETLCTWLIKGPANHKIELTFKYSSVSDRDCSFAYVEVYDGFSPTNTSFGRFCEHYWWKIIKSTGSSMYVTLWVDSTFKSNGVPLFDAVYKAVKNRQASGGSTAKSGNMLSGILVLSTLLAMFY